MVGYLFSILDDLFLFLGFFLFLGLNIDLFNFLLFGVILWELVLKVIEGKFGLLVDLDVLIKLNQ